MDDDDLSGLKKDLNATKYTGNEYLRITLSHFLIQWVFTLFIFIFFWKTIPLLKWTLLFLIPLGAYNLYHFFFQKKRFNHKIGELEKIIKEIEKK